MALPLPLSLALSFPLALDDVAGFEPEPEAEEVASFLKIWAADLRPLLAPPRLLTRLCEAGGLGVLGSPECRLLDEPGAIVRVLTGIYSKVM